MDEIAQAVKKMMDSTDFILGEEVKLFEQEFAAFCQAGNGVGVGSGTEALHLALRACDITHDDEVITAANTYIATALAISYTGARPVLVDIDPRTYNMDIENLEGAITEKTKAVIPVHLYGQPSDMDPILEVARKYNLYVIEDACQAHGAEYKTRRVGALGDIGCFSFYPGKNLGGFGDGGMMVTNDTNLAQRMRALRNYGQRVKYEHVVKGFNSRLDTLQAAFLRIKLSKLEEWNRSRNGHARYYSELMREFDEIITPEEDPSLTRHVYHLYVIRSEDRDGLQRHLLSKGITTGIHYPVPIHLQKCYQDLGYGVGSFPVTEKYAHRILSLPMFPELTRGQIERIVEEIGFFCKLK
jgi:dTDP-4-amino-4,6-dideoxygalactose transaminase